MKILLLGKNGMLGAEFLDFLNSKFVLDFLKVLGSSDSLEILATSREDLDILDYKELESKFKEFNPDLVINCTAYTAVDQAEEEEDLSIKINGDAVGKIAEFSKKYKANLIHFSTDYVFDGKNEDGYDEDFTTDRAPVNVYGKSKLEGEKLIEKIWIESFVDEGSKVNDSKFYIIRTAWLFGKYGANFVDTMLRLGKEKDQLSVVSDQFGSPTYAKDLVEAIWDNFIKPFSLQYSDNLDSNDSLSLLHNSKILDSGIYHLTNSGVCSWYDFAKEIFKQNNKINESKISNSENNEIDKKSRVNSFIEIDLQETDSQTFVRPAQRPKYSILKNTKLPEIRHWKDALFEYLN